MKPSTDELLKSTSIVMITLDEEDAIAKVVGDIKRVAPQSEVLIVDSGTDRTAEIARALGCAVIRQYPPQGYGNAMHTALTSASGEFVLTLDCDDTYPVDAIHALVRKLVDDNLHMVSGSRLGKRPQSMPLSNYMANLSFCWLARLICGVVSTDLHTGMRVYRKEAVNAYPYDPSYSALPVELQIGLVQIGYRCEEIGIDYLERKGVSKLRRFDGTMGTLRRIWHCRRFFNPRLRNLKAKILMQVGL